MNTIIDIHTHTFPGKIAERTIDQLSREAGIHPFSDGTAAGLCERMDRAGISRSFVLPVATSPRQVERINESAAAQNADSSPILSAGCMHPAYADYRSELARIASLGLLGIKIHPVYQGVDLDDIRFLRILDRAAELGLFVVTHTGDDIGFPGVIHCSPQMARSALKAVGDFTLVCAHMGGWGCWDEAAACLADTSALIDTSFSTGRITPRSDHEQPDFPLDMLDEDGFMRLFDAFGPERILFGTDSPWTDAEESVRFIRNLPIPEEEKCLILAGNARKLLHL